MIARAAWLATLISGPPAQAQPGPGAPAEDPGPGPTGAAASDPSDPDGTVLQVIERPDPDPPGQRTPERPQQFAVPVSTRRSRDPALRKARGILAGGIIFTVICGVGSALALVTVVRARPTGKNAIAGATGLLACTVGAIGMASYGATRLRKHRHLAEWTGGLGLRF